MTWEIRRIPLLSLVKVSFVVYLFLSLIVMLLYGLFIGSIAGLLGGVLADEFDLAPLTGGVLLIGGLVGSVIMASIYTFFTFLGGLIYNAVASVVGGLEMELEPSDVQAIQLDRVVQAASQIQPAEPVQQAVAAAATPGPQADAEPPSVTEKPAQSEPKSKPDHEQYMPKGGTSEDWGWGSGKRKPKE